MNTPPKSLVSSAVVRKDTHSPDMTAPPAKKLRMYNSLQPGDTTLQPRTDLTIATETLLSSSNVGCVSTILNTESIWAQSDQIASTNGGSHTCFPQYGLQNNADSRNISNVNSITTEYILGNMSSYPGQSSTEGVQSSSTNVTGRRTTVNVNDDDDDGDDDDVAYHALSQVDGNSNSKKPARPHASPVTPTADLHCFSLGGLGSKYLSPQTQQLASQPNTTSSESMVDQGSSTTNNNINITSNNNQQQPPQHVQMLPFAIDTIHHMNRPQLPMIMGSSGAAHHSSNMPAQDSFDADYTQIPTLLPHFGNNHHQLQQQQQQQQQQQLLSQNNTLHLASASNQHTGVHNTHTTGMSTRSETNNLNSMHAAAALRSQVPPPISAVSSTVQHQQQQQQQQQYMQQQQQQQQYQQQQYYQHFVSATYPSSNSVTTTSNTNSATTAAYDGAEYYGDLLKRRSKLPLNAVLGLRQWLRANICTPYPSSIEKQQLAAALQLQQSQVHNWLSNVRKRCLAPWLKSIGITLQPFKPLSQVDAQYVLKKIEEIPEDRYLGPI